MLCIGTRVAAYGPNDTKEDIAKREAELREEKRLHPEKFKRRKPLPGYVPIGFGLYENIYNGEWEVFDDTSED